MIRRKIDNSKDIASLIQYDINAGVYDMFPILKSRLLTIANKLIMAEYVVNYEGISKNDIDTLIMNDYLTE